MNELGLSITPVNNLLKFAGTMEAEFGYCDDIIVELDDTHALVVMSLVLLVVRYA